MRLALLDAYPGQKWRNKVKNYSDAQVHAIYTRLKLKGII